MRTLYCVPGVAVESLKSFETREEPASTLKIQEF